MEEFKGHTPGPWMLIGFTIKRTGAHSSDQDDICYMNEEGGNAESDWFADPAVIAADAALLAAAPALLAERDRLRFLNAELVEALKDALEQLTGLEDDCYRYGMRRTNERVNMSSCAKLKATNALLKAFKG
jgi:hypothetical protein